MLKESGQLSLILQNGLQKDFLELDHLSYHSHVKKDIPYRKSGYAQMKISVKKHKYGFIQYYPSLVSTRAIVIYIFPSPPLVSLGCLCAFAPAEIVEFCRTSQVRSTSPAAAVRSSESSIRPRCRGCATVSNLARIPSVCLLGAQEEFLKNWNISGTAKKLL